jgi:hypothetical protein
MPPTAEPAIMSGKTQVLGSITVIDVCINATGSFDFDATDSMKKKNTSAITIRTRPAMTIRQFLRRIAASSDRKDESLQSLSMLFHCLKLSLRELSGSQRQLFEKRFNIYALIIWWQRFHRDLFRTGEFLR